MLAAFRPDTVKINGSIRDSVLIGISPNDISNAGFYEGIIGVN